jgi:LmbE family N-acetylglucosaminyl deacetylase
MSQIRAALRLCLKVGIASLLLTACDSQVRDPSGTATSVFVVAHPDDWQLFMGDVAFEQISTGQPVIFLYTTAGGADREEDYWQARERAARASTYAAANWRQQTTAEGEDADCGRSIVKGHSLLRCSYRNTRSFFLRLPDGDFTGKGFPETRTQALAKLHAGNGEALGAIDATTEYVSWSDLRSTVQILLGSELADVRAGERTLHTHDPDTTHNPDDHSDHTLTGHLVRETATALGASVIYYAGYDIANRPANLPLDRVMSKTAVFLAYERQTLLANPEWSAYGSAPAEYSAWLFRTYRRSGASH